MSVKHPNKVEHLTDQQIADTVRSIRRKGNTSPTPQSRAGLIVTEEDRKLVAQLLSECLVAYRQPKVHSDEELAERLDIYFQTCSEKGIIPTVEEMCMWTGYDIRTVLDWEKERRGGVGPQSAVIIKNAKNFLQSFDSKLVTSGKMNFLAYCFRAKNYYGMVDKQDIVVAPGNPMGEIADKKELEEKLADVVLDEDEFEEK